MNKSEYYTESGYSDYYSDENKSKGAAEKVVEEVKNVLKPIHNSEYSEEKKGNKSEQNVKHEEDKNDDEEIELKSRNDSDHQESKPVEEEKQEYEYKEIKPFKYKNGKRKYLFRDDSEDRENKLDAVRPENKWLRDRENSESIHKNKRKLAKNVKSPKGKSKYLLFASSSDSDNEERAIKALQKTEKDAVTKLNNKYLSSDSEDDVRSRDLQIRPVQDKPENIDLSQVEKKQTSKFLIESSSDEEMNFPEHRKQPKPKKEKQKKDPRLEELIETTRKVNDRNAKRLLEEEKKRQEELQSQMSENSTLSTKTSEKPKKKVVKSRNIDSSLVSHGSPMDKKFIKIQASDSDSAEFDDEKLNTPRKTFKSDPAKNRLNKYVVERSEISQNS